MLQVNHMGGSQKCKLSSRLSVYQTTVAYPVPTPSATPSCQPCQEALSMALLTAASIPSSSWSMLNQPACLFLVVSKRLRNNERRTRSIRSQIYCVTRCYVKYNLKVRCDLASCQPSLHWLRIALLCGCRVFAQCYLPIRQPRPVSPICIA